MKASWLTSDPRRPVVALFVGGYVAIAFAVRDLYPFSKFDMYSHYTDSASRVIARDARGAVSEIERWDGWRCEAPVDLSFSPDRCGTARRVEIARNQDGFRAAYIAGHSAPAGGGEPIEIVRRIWWLDGRGGARVLDCPIQRCTAVRR
jgi:hypothetical protein